MSTPIELALNGQMNALATFGLEKISWASTALRVGMPLAAYALADDEHKLPAAGLGLMGALALTRNGKAPVVAPAPHPAPVAAPATPPAPPAPTPKKTPVAAPTAPVAVQAKSEPAPLPTPETAMNMKEMNFFIIRPH